MIFDLLKVPVARCPSCAWVYLRDADGRLLGPINGSSFNPVEREALLQEIARALNSHEAVVTVLRDLISLTEHLPDINAGQYAYQSPELRSALEAARIALADAMGQRESVGSLDA